MNEKLISRIEDVIDIIKDIQTENPNVSLLFSALIENDDTYRHMTYLGGKRDEIATNYVHLGKNVSEELRIDE